MNGTLCVACSRLTVLVPVDGVDAAAVRSNRTARPTRCVQCQTSIRTRRTRTWQHTTHKTRARGLNESLRHESGTASNAVAAQLLPSLTIHLPHMDAVRCGGECERHGVTTRVARQRNVLSEPHRPQVIQRLGSPHMIALSAVVLKS